MAGKTTWITNLFNEKLNVSLRNKCLENNEGQTKIMTCYKLIDNNIDDIYADYIEFISEKLESLYIKNYKIILEQFNDFIKILEKFGVLSNLDGLKIS